MKDGDKYGPSCSNIRLVQLYPAKYFKFSFTFLSLTTFLISGLDHHESEIFFIVTQPLLCDLQLNI